MELENIKVEGRIGTWYEIDRLEKDSFVYVLLEHEEYGDEVPGIVILWTNDRTPNGEIPKQYEVGEGYDDIITILEDNNII